MEWIQEQRWAAQGMGGRVYKVFPFTNMPKFGANVSYFDENGNPVVLPIGGQYDTPDEAKAVCEKRITRRILETPKTAEESWPKPPPPTPVPFQPTPPPAPVQK